MSPDEYHITAFSCKADPAILNNSAVVGTCIDKLIRAGNYTKLGEVSHSFKPSGITSLALLSESHIAIHTWPELGIAKVVIATCRNESNDEVYERIIMSTLKGTHIRVSEVVNV